MKNLTFFFLLSWTFILDPVWLSGQCVSSCTNENTFVGSFAGANITSGNENTFVGYRAGRATSNGDANSFFGGDAGRFNTSGTWNSFFGRDAGRANTTGDDNSFFGEGSGRANTTGNSNSFFGVFSGRSNTTGHSNSFVGKSAGSSNTTGVENSFFGRNAGVANTTGHSNSFVGYNSGRANTTGNFNSFFGREAGRFNITGSNNTMIGLEAGYSNESSDALTALGYQAGYHARGHRITCLGHQAGPDSLDGDQTDRLYIDVEQKTDALIYGEFDNDFVRINGTFEVTAGLSNPSSRDLKTAFTPIASQEVLAKVATLEIQEWQYKNRPDERHLGPVAEDFYAAFGYGSDDSHISTIDADGVALLAIQALHDKTRQQEELIRKQQAEMKLYELKLQQQQEELATQQKEIDALSDLVEQINKKMVE